MNDQDSQGWVSDGEKYALLGLNLKGDKSGFAESSDPEMSTRRRLNVPPST